MKDLAGHCGFIEHITQLSFLISSFKMIAESISIVITGMIDNNGCKLIIRSLFRNNYAIKKKKKCSLSIYRLRVTIYCINERQIYIDI